MAKTAATLLTEALERFLLGSGQPLSVKDVTVSEVGQDNHFFKRSASNEEASPYISKAVNCVCEITLACGSDYDVWMKVAYEMKPQDSDIDDLLRAIKNNVFTFSFTNKYLPPMAALNIGFHVHQPAVLETFYELREAGAGLASGCGLDSMIDYIMAEELTAETLLWLLEAKLNKKQAGFDDALLAAIDKEIREQTVAMLSLSMV